MSSVSDQGRRENSELDRTAFIRRLGDSLAGTWRARSNEDLQDDFGNHYGVRRL
jgi:hypothetical protein